jgi:hypothetical protein
MNKLVTILLGALAGLYLIGHNANQQQTAAATTSTSTASSQPTATPKQTATPQPVSAITWRQVNAIYNLQSKKTDLQKDAAWPQFKGQRIVWTGKVRAIADGWFSGFTLQVKMNRDTFTSDLLIRLKPSEKSKAMQLEEGDTVTFTGILDSWGTLLPITLDDGEIIKG